MSKEMTTDAVILQIRKAFEGVKRPERAQIASCPCGECVEIVEYFDSAPQFEIASDVLSGFSAAVTLFSDAAFCYWLPAFLVAALATPEVVGDLSLRIAWALDDGPNHPTRTVLLSDAQREAVVIFLETAGRIDSRDSLEFNAIAVRIRDKDSTLPN